MRTVSKIAAIAGLALTVAACGGQEDANAVDANATSTTEPLEPIEGTTNDMMSVDAANNMSGGMMADNSMTTNSTSGNMMMSNNMMSGNMSDMSTNTTTTNTSTTTTNAM